MPEFIIRNEADYIKIANRVTAKPRRDSDPIWLFKTHLRLGGSLPGAQLIYTHRDPRDVLISFQRFMRCNFDRALAEVVEMTATCDHYRSVVHVPKLDLDYRDIVADPHGAIARIARHIRVDAAPAEIETLARNLSKPAVQSIIAACEAKLSALADANQPVPSELYSINADGSARAFDPVTGFQSRHVSDYGDGDWSRLLSPDQLRQMEARLGPWLEANGYA